MMQQSKLQKIAKERYYIMKKIFSFIIAVVSIIVTLSVNASAFSSNPLISSEIAGSNIEMNILEDDIEYYDFLFGTSNVDIMYEYAIPYYTYNNAISYDELSDVYSFSGNYFVPVTSSSGSFIGFAEYSQTNDGKWEIISTSSGDYYDGLYETMFTGSIYSGFSSAFLTGDALFNELGIVFDSNTDVFFDYTAYFIDTSSVLGARSVSAYSDYFINGDAKLTEIANRITNNPTSEGNTVTDGLPEVDIPISEEKVELSPDEIQNDFPIEEQEEPLIDNNGSIPEGVLTEGNEFTEVENPKTGSSSILPAIIAVGTIGISLFLLGKKK